MIAFDGVMWRAAIVVRWIALILGTLLVLLFLAFCIGEGLPNFFSLTASEKLQFICIACMAVGLLLCWKWELPGGLLVVASFAVLIAVSPTHLKVWLFWMLAFIGAVHLLCWARLRQGIPAGLLPWRISPFFVLAIVGTVAAFVLLGANEIFGEPPLMTTTLRPSRDLAGTWTAANGDVQVAILPDASVTGKVGNDALHDSRISNNRSWFGRLMHWRTDYRIRGRIGQDRLEVLLQRQGRNLDVSLWRLQDCSNCDSERPLRVTLRKPGDRH